MASYELHHGECLDVMRGMPSASVDSIVTDPPYGLRFMGRAWDYRVPNVEEWAECLRVLKPGGHLLAFGGARTYHRLVVNVEDAGFEIRDQLMWMYGSGMPKSHNLKGEHEGYGTALKPAHEPIVMARKPLAGTVAANMAIHGTGALNINRCRVSTTETLGRWPANLLHDGSEEVIALFPAQAGASAPVKGTEASKASTGNVTGKRERVKGAFHADQGSAARFFYCAKASPTERNQGVTGKNSHPTVKPLDLMRYLCRLVTPPGGVVLDPFMGSGSTGRAALREGMSFIGIEKEADHVVLARERLAFEFLASVS